MTKTLDSAIVVAVLAALIAGAPPAMAAEPGWGLRVGGVYVQPTASGGVEGALGWSLGLEYRVSPRIGVELRGFTSEAEDEAVFEFFDARVRIESRVRTVPILAQLDVHLTPNHRADLYVGPVLGWARTSDLTVRLEARVPGEPDFVAEDRLATDDEFVWGAHLGLDLPLGDGGSFLTTGVTFLRQGVTVRGLDAEDEPLIEDFDIDPLALQVGYGYRF